MHRQTDPGSETFLKTFGETYEEEHVGPHFFGYLIEALPVSSMASRGRYRFIAAYLGHDAWFRWAAGIPYMDFLWVF